MSPRNVEYNTSTNDHNNHPGLLAPNRRVTVVIVTKVGSEIPFLVITKLIKPSKLIKVRNGN